MTSFATHTSTAVWLGIIVVQALAVSSSVGSRTTADDHDLIGRIKEIRRSNPLDDIILHPFGGRGLPYLTEIVFPSPCHQPQYGIKIAIDTGSSDFWLDSRPWCECTEKEAEGDLAFARSLCQWIGKEKGKGGQAIPYDDNSKVTGAFIEETLFFGKSGTLEDITFLAAWDFEPKESFEGRNAPTGLVGLGYIRNQQTRHDSYYTLPYVLRQSEMTASIAFSMWFKDTGRRDDFQGSIFFGGYVTNYYKGALTTFKIPNDDKLKKPTEIIIELDRITFKGVDAMNSCKDKLPVLLDTGTYSSFLPLDVFKKIVKQIGDYTLEKNDVRVYGVIKDCTRVDFDEEITFQFGKLKVPVPLKDIIRKVTKAEARDSNKPWLREGRCITHGIAAKPGSEGALVENAFSGEPPLSHSFRHILGVTVLRHLFVLYDLTQREVALALSDQDAIRTEQPELFDFHDETLHQKQEPYNPIEGMQISCPL